MLQSIQYKNVWSQTFHLKNSRCTVRLLGNGIWHRHKTSTGGVSGRSRSRLHLTLTSGAMLRSRVSRWHCLTSISIHRMERSIVDHHGMLCASGRYTQALHIIICYLDRVGPVSRCDEFGSDHEVALRPVPY